MALRFDASADRLTRTANLPSITGFTICGVSVINTDRGASTYQPLITVTPEAAAYILWGGGASHLSKMLLGSYNGSSENNIEFTSRPAVGVRFFWYIRCSGSGANLLQAGWMPFGDTSFTEQRSTTLISTPSTAAIYINGDAYGDWSNQDYNAVKVWNVALSDAELLAEAASERAVKTSGLLIDSPMTGANVTAAAADLSGNGYNWTVNGTLAVVAGPSYSISGTGAVTLDGFSLSSAGQVAITGASALSLAAATLSSAGALAIVGGASVSLESLILTAAGGASPITAEAALTLDAATVSAAGANVLAGSSDLTLADASVAAAGSVALAGASAMTLAAASLSAVGKVALVASTAVDLEAIGLSSAGALVVKGVLAETLDAFALTAAGADLSPRTGEAAITLSDFGLTARGSFLIYASPLAPTTLTAPALAAASGLTASPLAATSITAPPL